MSRPGPVDPIARAERVAKWNLEREAVFSLLDTKRLGERQLEETERQHVSDAMEGEQRSDEVQPPGTSEVRPGAG